MESAVHKAKIKQLEAEIQLMRNSVQIETGRITAGIRTIKTGRMYIEKNMDFRENLDSRILKFMSRNKKLIVSQKSAEGTLFPGFGVKVIDFASYRQEKFINTCTKALSDFSIDSTESFVLTASKDPICKIYSLKTNLTTSSFSPSGTPIWSCTIDKTRPDNVFLGGQNGVTYIHDIRNSVQVLKELTTLNNRLPVKFIIPMKENETFPLGGLFVVHIRGIGFNEFLPNGDFEQTTLNFDEPILVASYDERTEMLLVTTNPSGQGVDFKQSRHHLMKLVKESGIPVLQEIFSFNGSPAPMPASSRPTQLKVPDGFIVASYLDSTKMLQMRSPSAGILHEIGISDPITDICPIYLENSFFIGALSFSRCRLLKVNLGY